MNVPDDLLYTNSHEWVRVEGDTATVGITDFAQDQLSDLTFIELPSEGDELESGKEVAVVESVKAASDVYSPVSGTVTEVNRELEDNPGLLNTDPFGKGWLFKVQMSNQDELDAMLDPADYKDLLPAGD